MHTCIKKTYILPEPQCCYNWTEHSGEYNSNCIVSERSYPPLRATVNHLCTVYTLCLNWPFLDLIAVSNSILISQTRTVWNPVQFGSHFNNNCLPFIFLEVSSFSGYISQKTITFTK